MEENAHEKQYRDIHRLNPGLFSHKLCEAENLATRVGHVATWQRKGRYWNDDMFFFVGVNMVKQPTLKDGIQ